MTTFIAIVQAEDDGGYTASFPDFSGCLVSSPTLGEVIVKAREALLRHIEGLLEAEQVIQSPTAIEALQRTSALLFAAIDVPDDLGFVHVDIPVPALSLARIETFAERNGLSLAALFVKAVDRWSLQEAVPRESEDGISSSPALFDFGSPPELRVEAAAAEFGPAHLPRAGDGEEVGPGENAGGITAELARLLDDRPERKAVEVVLSRAAHVADEGRQHPERS